MTGQFTPTGNFVARGADRVNPALVDILKLAAQQSGMNVEAYSGYRPGDPRQHGHGSATDVRIIGPDGKAISNYQDPKSFQTYEKFARTARDIQMAQHPELADAFRWGGYFSGGKGKYGAMDLMHFDVGGGRGLGMAGGSWDKGLTPQQAAIWGMKGGNPQAPVQASGLASAFTPQSSTTGAPTGAPDGMPALAPQAMAMMSGGAAPNSAQNGPLAPTGDPGGMMFGDIASMFLQGEQQRQKRRKDEQDAEQARRQALFGGGLPGLYG